MRFTKNTRLNLSWNMHFVQNNRLLKSFLSFLPPSMKALHRFKINWFTVKTKIFYLFWYKACWLTVSYCMNCVPTVLCWPLYFHTFLFFVLSRYCRVLYHRGTMEHSGLHFSLLKFQNRRPFQTIGLRGEDTRQFLEK